MPNKETNTDRLIREILKTSPQFTLSDNFADKMAEKAGRKFAWKQYFNEFLLYLGVITGILVLSGVMTYFWLESNWSRWLEIVSTNSAVVIGAVFLLLFILFADKVLLRYFLNGSMVSRD